MESIDENLKFDIFFNKSVDYYKRQLEYYNEGSRCSFNVPAFFLGIFWMAYRKMYIHILFFFIIQISFAYLINILLYNELITLEIYRLLDIASLFINGLLFGVLSNKLYIKKYLRTMNKISMMDIGDGNEILKNKGGTSLFAPINMLIGLICILYFISSVSII